MLNTNTLVIVADGESAVIWRNHGHNSPDLQQVEALTLASMAADGPAGASPVESSPHDQNEAAFVHHLVHRLNAMALANALPDEVVIIADPSSLGQMRPHYHAELKRRIVKEMPKTLVKASKKDLEKALS